MSEAAQVAELPRSLLERLAATAAIPDASDNSSPPDPTFDISAPLARIQETWRFIEACHKEIRELDELLSTSENREANTAAQLSRAQQQIADLEQALAAEKHRAARAEALAERVTHRAEELEVAKSDARQALQTLATALEGTFRDLPDVSAQYRAAA